MSSLPELFDTHAHLDDEHFGSDLEAVLRRASGAGVATIVTVGTTAASSGVAVDIARRFGNVFAAVGIQPNYAAEAQPGDFDRITELAADPRVRAIGETGLDAYWDYAPFPLQQALFDRHLQLAQQMNLPVIVHMRDCGEATLAQLRAACQRSPLRGIMHSFTGDVELAHQCLELGLHISFAGMVTFKKSAQLREIAAEIPDDRILIETDAPYLAPHPHRGKRPNEPALLVHTARCLAEVRGVSLAVFAAQTAENARRLLGVEASSA